MTTQIQVTHHEDKKTHSLIVVSNRLPFVLKRNATTNALERHARYIMHFIIFLIKVFYIIQCLKI